MFQLLFALLLAAMPANFPRSPIVESGRMGNAVVSVHADYSVSAVALSEKVVLCSVADARDDSPQDPPAACVSTTWQSVDNTAHTVSTPIVSTTPAGLARAIDLHTELVRQMKIIYPPRQNP